MPVCKYLDTRINRCYFGDSCKCKEGDQESASAGYHDFDCYYTEFDEYPRVLEFPGFSEHGG